MENTALNFESELEYLREMEHIVTEEKQEPELLVFALQFRTTDGRVKQMNQYFVVADNLTNAVEKAERWLSTAKDGPAKDLQLQAIQTSGVLID